MSTIIGCPICMEDITENVEYLPCAHKFHTDCIHVWLSNNSECPICRIPFFISGPEHLDAYITYKKKQDDQHAMESEFFQRLSNGEISFVNNTLYSITDQSNSNESEISPLVLSNNSILHNINMRILVPLNLINNMLQNNLNISSTELDTNIPEDPNIHEDT